MNIVYIDAEQCAEDRRTWDGRVQHRCTSRGSEHFDGKLWCRRHHPPTAEARQAARRAAAIARVDARVRAGLETQRRRLAEERYCEGISTEDLEAGRVAL